MTHARLYLRPTGWGQGLQLAGGQTRFSQLEISTRHGPAVASRQTIAAADHAAFALTLAPEQRAPFAAQFANLTAPRPPLVLPSGPLAFDSPGVIGILNVTPDSFSDGGRHGDPDRAAAAAIAMLGAGAVLVDIGGESTRPRAPQVALEEELARVTPVLDRLAAKVGRRLPLSIDTRKAAVMRVALAAGVGLVNDVSALTHDRLALALVAQAGCPVVLMHAQGIPQTMQAAPHYDDVLCDVFDWLGARIAACVAAGIARDRIIVDSGIGFGKTVAHNLALLRGIGMLHGLGCPILLGVSRKKMIGVLGGDVAVADRLGGSLALALAGLGQGVQLLRVHDVVQTVQAVKLWAAVQGAGGN